MSKPRNRPSVPPQHFLGLVLTKALGSVLLLASVAIALHPHYRCPTRIQVFSIYALIGVGIAVLLVKDSKEVTTSYKVRNLTVVLTGGVALPFLLFWTDPLSHFMPDDCHYVNLTVFVHGRQGRQDMILRQQGYVLLDLEGERKRASINENGQAFFQHMHLGDSVRLAIDFSEPYQALRPDTAYVVSETGVIYLPVALQGIDKIHGVTLCEDAPLAGVVVRTGTLADTSDATGTFAFSVPVSFQKKRYEVQFTKPGFKTKTYTIAPQTGEDVGVIMEKVVRSAHLTKQ